MPPIKSVAIGPGSLVIQVYNSQWSSKRPQCLEIPCLSLLGPAIHGRPQAAWDLNAQSNLDEFFAHLPFPSIGPAPRRRNGFTPNRWSRKRLSLRLVGLGLISFFSSVDGKTKCHLAKWCHSTCIEDLSRVCLSWLAAILLCLHVLQKFWCSLMQSSFQHM